MIFSLAISKHEKNKAYPVISTNYSSTLFINDSKSAWQKILRLVSQGSILASVSFNIFINDSKAKVGSMLIVFVDKHGAESNKNILVVQERLNGRTCAYLIKI